jgi:uncharacterized protein YjaZ
VGDNFLYILRKWRTISKYIYDFVGGEYDDSSIIKILASYYHHDYRFSYLMTKDGTEVDLVIERPGLTTLFIYLL